MGVLNSRISGSYTVADPDLQISVCVCGGGGGGSQKKFFLGPSGLSLFKNKGKRGPRKDGHFLLTRK